MISINKEARTGLLDEDQYFPRSVNQPYQQYAGGYHQREGYATTSPTAPRPSTESRLYVPNSKWQWSFLSIVLLQAIVGLALEAFVFAEFQTNLENSGDKTIRARTVPTYLSLYIFGFLYELWLVYDALRLKNEIQIIGLCMYNVGLFIEATVQIHQIHDAVNFLYAPDTGGPSEINSDFWSDVHAYIVAVPCVIALTTVLMAGAAWMLYKEFAWSIYKHISADLGLKRRYLSFQIYITLLKFDFFFFLAFTVQFLVVVKDTTDFEFYITIAALPITVVFLFLAAFWVRRESVVGMSITLIVYFTALAYFLFKLVRMYDSPPDRIQDYLPARSSLTTFAVITVVLLIVTIVYAFLCMFNFGKGLKEHIMSNRKRRKESVDLSKLYSNTAPLTAPGGGRMEID